MEYDLINQISAGEVVERPANIVKELIENSIDSDATKIEVFLRNSGLQSIIVNDNGNGISESELPTAILRYATSKLTKNNLNEIDNFGFRGEALPAIASISNMKIKSDIAIVPQQIRKGNPLSQSLKDIDAFPNYLISMISAGEETGSLITVFDKISNHLDMQLENSLERLNKLIEPIIIVFVGIVVSIIAFAILSPILSLNEFV